MNFKWKKIGLLATSLIIVVSFTACGFSKSQGANAAPALVTLAQEKKDTVTVKRGDIERKSTMEGRVIPANAKEMYFKGKGGFLSKINVKVGDEVKKGDIIAQLDMDDISEQIKQQEIQFQLAQIDWDEASKNNASEFDKKRLQLRLDSEQMRLNQLNESLKNSTLISDMTGVVVGMQNLSVHQRIEPLEPVVVVAEKNKFLIQCNVRNAKLTLGTKVQIGIKIVIAQPCAEGQVISNSFLETNNVQGSSVNSESIQDNSKIVIKLDSEPTNFKFGDSVTVHYSEEKKTDILIIATKAIKNGAGNHPYVRVLKDDGITEKYIATGISDNENTEIINGLTENDTIIVD